MFKTIFALLRRLPWWLYVILVFAGIVAIIVVGPKFLRFYSRTLSNSPNLIGQWFRDPDSRSGLETIREHIPCEGAPFILPSDGFIGLLWNDPAGPYTVLNRHSGLDIFGDGAPGELPVYAAYGGYLTRLPDWFATIIIRHDDPLQPGRTIWTYYTHMGSRDGTESYIVDSFPAGTGGVWVEQGTLLGYQGKYAGNGGSVGLHLHFSIVLSDDNGAFKNEAVIANTLDPSPYLGMDVNIDSLPERPIGCRE